MKNTVLLTCIALFGFMFLLSSGNTHEVTLFTSNPISTSIQERQDSGNLWHQTQVSLDTTQQPDLETTEEPDAIQPELDSPYVEEETGKTEETEEQLEPRDTMEPTRPEVLVAYYGHPNSRFMGIVGRHSLPELVELVTATAQAYQELMPDYAVVPAIYLIYGTVQPEGRIGFMSDAMVNRYIEYAGEHNVHIILDHQIGRYTLLQTMDRLLPYLVHPHVHLAVDFEWRTERPMQEIGFVRGEELTWMQQYMSDFLVRNNLPNTRFLIFHQFKSHMVRNHGAIQIGFPQVELVHSTSGWGSPDEKRSTHAYNASITQIPTKAFKLWYFYSDRPGIHFDNPLMTHQEVVNLNPRPRIIMYQ